MPEDEGTLALDNVITHDDRAIFMMDQISRAARKAFDVRAGRGDPQRVPEPDGHRQET